MLYRPGSLYLSLCPLGPATRDPDQAVSTWSEQQVCLEEPIAIDGKDVRGASKQTQEGSRMMVAAITHSTSVVLGQTEVSAKSNEITAVRRLANTIDVAGRVVTLDALHAQHKTAKCLLERQAHYVITAIKKNQPTMLEDLKAIDFSQAPSHETHEKGHGAAMHSCSITLCSRRDYRDLVLLRSRW